MKHGALFLALLALSSCASGGHDGDFDGIPRSYHERGKFSGAVLVAHGDRIEYTGAFGLADESWGIPNTVQTRFQIGSLTKQFTAALVLDLADQGLIVFDAPVSRYLPEYRSETGVRVTIRDLLAHTSGIPDFVRRPDIMDIVMHSLSPQDVVSRYCSEPLEFPPGTHFRYSNCGYLILGAVYERLAGRSYREGIAALAARAGLQNTGVAGPRDVVPRLARAYVVADGTQKLAPYIDWSVAFSSGSISSTVEDLWRWRTALMAGRVLPARMVSEVFSFRPHGYSFGWHVGRTDRGHLEEFLSSDYDVHEPSAGMHIRLASHSGDLPGFHSSMTILLDGSWTVILLDNHDSHELPALAAAILRAAIGPPHA